MSERTPHDVFVEGGVAGQICDPDLEYLCILE
jgi:hypothetical protein